MTALFITTAIFAHLLLFGTYKTVMRKEIGANGAVALLAAMFFAIFFWVSMVMKVVEWVLK